MTKLIDFLYDLISIIGYSLLFIWKIVLVIVVGTIGFIIIGWRFFFILLLSVIVYILLTNGGQL